MVDTILVIDDEESIRSAIKRAFKEHNVIEADTVEVGIEKTRDEFPDIILLDQNLPDGTGLELLPKLKAIDTEVPIIFLTGHGSIDIAVDALKAGATEFLEKPFRIEKIKSSVEILLDKQKLERRVAKLSGGKKSRKQCIAQSLGMKKVTSLIKKVAAVPSTTVLIQGESGVGKELVAKGIHDRSSRSDSTFIAINCAALSENLLEAELFGYAPGAFTGADAKGKDGLFIAANGGTIFLDEVGEMPLVLQTKLLRVLQERCIRKVGGLEDLAVDVRVVAATNRDLRKEVVTGTFRKDLYYRLRVVPIYVPPLRDRIGDILPLAKHFLKTLGPELGRSELKLSKESETAMQEYCWPGNVRELSNAIERAVITTIEKEITPNDLCMDEIIDPETEEEAISMEQSSAENTAATIPEDAVMLLKGDRNLASIEKRIINAVIKETNGKKTKAAEMLGINRTTLYNKLKDLGLDNE